MNSLKKSFLMFCATLAISAVVSTGTTQAAAKSLVQSVTNPDADFREQLRVLVAGNHRHDDGKVLAPDGTTTGNARRGGSMLLGGNPTSGMTVPNSVPERNMDASRKAGRRRVPLKTISLNSDRSRVLGKMVAVRKPDDSIRDELPRDARLAFFRGGDDKEEGTTTGNARRGGRRRFSNSFGNLLSQRGGGDEGTTTGNGRRGGRRRFSSPFGVHLAGRGEVFQGSPADGNGGGYGATSGQPLSFFLAYSGDEEVASSGTSITGRN